MGLSFAIDALYDTDFRAGDACEWRLHHDGRTYPTIAAIGECFAAAECSLTIRHTLLFECYRATWRDATGSCAGAVTGQTAEEAAVFALSQLRRQTHYVSH